MEDVTKEEFKSYLPHHYSESNFHRLKGAEDQGISVNSFNSFINQAKDLFFSYNWGTDDLNRDNQSRVRSLFNALKSKGFKIWFDQIEIRADIQGDMTMGIDNSSCIIVFITDLYMRKVYGQGPNGLLDNVLFEFTHISQTKPRNKIIPVIMESRCLDPNLWIGKVRAVLSTVKYIDCTNDSLLTNVVKEILERFKKQENSYFMKDVKPLPNKTFLSIRNNIKQVPTRANSQNKLPQGRISGQNENKSEQSVSYDHLLKVVLVGDSCVGKTNIIEMYHNGTFSEWVTTVGVDYRIKIVQMERKKIKLQTWDTAGQEAYRTITNAYFRGSDAVALVFDVTSRKSFTNVGLWMEEARKGCSGKSNFFLVGNKCDLEPPCEIREVFKEDAILFAEQNNIPYIEISAKRNINIDELFSTIVHDTVTAKEKEAIKQQQEAITIQPPAVFNAKLFERRGSLYNDNKLDKHWKNHIWIPDQDVRDCYLCFKKFSVFPFYTFKSHCRQCGKLFCSSHCKTRIPLPNCGYLSPTKVCDLCMNINGARTQFTRTYQLRQEGKLQQRQKLFDILQTNKNIDNIDDMTELFNIKMNHYLDSFKSLIQITNRYWNQEGEYSIIHQGRMKQTQEKVIIKVYKFWLCYNEKELKIELNCLQKCNHPNIIKILHVSDDFNHYPYIVFPYREYGTLKDYFMKGNKVSFSIRWLLLKQIARALHYLHSEVSMLHNDICAANILVIYPIDEFKNPTSVSNIPLIELFDLNCACSIIDSQKVFLPRATHRAPEIFERKTYSTPSDMYSYCCLITEIFGCCDESVFKNYSLFETEISKMVVGGFRPFFFYLPQHGHPENDTVRNTSPVKLLEQEVVTKGWNRNPSARPTFVDALYILDQFEVI